jgi:hypothetical protein
MPEPHAPPEKYDFKEPHQTGAIKCRRVVDGAPILYVAHDEDGGWQFLCGGEHPDGGADGGLLVCLGCSVGEDPSLNALAGLARGQRAIREGSEAPWRSEAEDPRWRRVLGRRWTCRTCGEEHDGVFHLACARPDQWPGSAEKAPNEEVLRSTNFLSEDFCILEGEHFFVRCVLELPLKGTAGECFGFGVWSSLSEANFARYRETFDSGQQGDLGPWFGWFSNRLKGYPDTLNLKCQVHPRAGRRRPWIEIVDAEHPLAVEQRDGITVERLVELLALDGHTIDLSPHGEATPEGSVDRSRPSWWQRLWTRGR